MSAQGVFCLSFDGEEVHGERRWREVPRSLGHHAIRLNFRCPLLPVQLSHLVGRYHDFRLLVMSLLCWCYFDTLHGGVPSDARYLLTLWHGPPQWIGEESHGITAVNTTAAECKLRDAIYSPKSGAKRMWQLIIYILPGRQ
ncbi:hypothetical protein LZ32DRAFT_339079 [Colletotrichum eremochloae]|nr:hypothetical protein LZ32DRAFT_339079 [Colletotrichum eremochloae]